ncbi:type VII toxin-antitoxin system MntA family adenylyltransferase antitoxin [Candidatus Nitrosacidococcus sp. I8]|uniref:type VII toxin-antitoxin system MntA family adenylyltransferase antitoxin n=1 Tax=Candidatus Nitrosacidococcus sp. I8 TaxID=2942908 RepID=UPI002227C97F|nr:nucleotidyltransferase domain-containing protein [Candidatus Nitrosacidococcus sp. I8]CAH9018331.1 hypothetical protein NURINAE_00864 [Candidatus Nitrosacidococcus sp. I8]
MLDVQHLQIKFVKGINYLKQNISDLWPVYIFGSQVTGKTWKESDIDLAVLARQPLEKLYRYELQEALIEIFNQEVDLVDLKPASTVFRMEIISKGQRLFVADSVLIDVELFEDRVFLDYVQLNEDRAGILADICQRGSIY